MRTDCDLRFSALNFGERPDEKKIQGRLQRFESNSGCFLGDPVYMRTNSTLDVCMYRFIFNLGRLFLFSIRLSQRERAEREGILIILVALKFSPRHHPLAFHKGT